MKYLSKILFTLFLSLIFLTCNKNEELNISTVQKIKQIQPEQFGRFHNEAILELLNHPEYNINDGIKKKMLIMYELMSTKYPDFFYKDLDMEYYISNFLEGFNIIDFSYNELIEKVLKFDIDENLKEFILLGADTTYDKYLLIDRNQLIIFNSVKDSSFDLWSNKAPNKYIIDQNSFAKACDPTQQVIIADAAASLAFVWNPPVSIIAGAAASLLVREQQIQNYDRCI